MKQNTDYSQIYKAVAGAPDFPAKQAEKLLSSLPWGSRDIAAALYLLPFQDTEDKDIMAYAQTVTALFFSFLIQDEFAKKTAFSEAEAILYGDYLFAVALSLIPPAAEGENYLPLLDRVCHGNELKPKHKLAEKTEENCLRFAREDHGEFFRRVAEESARKAGYNEEEKAAYGDFAEDFGTLWGIFYENYHVDTAPLFAAVEKRIKDFPAGENLWSVAKKWRKNSLEDQ